MRSLLIRVHLLHILDRSNQMTRSSFTDLVQLAMRSKFSMISPICLRVDYKGKVVVVNDINNESEASINAGLLDKGSAITNPKNLA